jgi:PKD repeat protein
MSYAWTFGDGGTGSGPTLTHAYSAGGAYTVTLAVTDNGGATSTHTATVVVSPPTLHVGDLDGMSVSQKNTWTASVTITAHDSSHGVIANATVGGSWNDGSTSACTTSASGQCTVSRSGIHKTVSSVLFTVTSVARPTFVYKPADNHDPDGESNGTTITVPKQ